MFSLLNVTLGEYFTNVWHSISEFFSARYTDLLTFLIVLITGFVAIKLLINLLKQIFVKRNLENIAVSFIIGILKYVLYLVLILVLLDIVGVNITGVVTAISAVILAIGMALKDSMANFASGIIIVSTKLYRKGDYVKVQDKEGRVESINLLFTVLDTYNKQKVIIPNSQITSDSVINVFSDELRRMDFDLSVAYDSDVELVKKVVTQTMLCDGRVKTEPQPFCGLHKFNQSSIDFFACCWVSPEDYWEVFFFLTEQIFNEFKRNGIQIPFQQTEVRLLTNKVKMPVNGKSLPKRVEKTQEEIKSAHQSTVDKQHKLEDEQHGIPNK